MARAQTRKTAAELSPEADPRAALDGQELLKHAAPVLRMLEEDLLARARGSAAMTLALQGRYKEEKDARRTAEPFELWQRAFVEQVAAAWLLGCVFVRTLEDRGLVERNRLAGPGALDSQRSFFELAPSLTERDYLLTVFRELEHFAAARELFDARHNPLWLLGPSAEAAKALLALFRSPSAEAPAFRFGGRDTRLLGDLYQDLSEAVRKRYALLQTPHFVEAYILDHTLEPAITRFGLEATTLIDSPHPRGNKTQGRMRRARPHRRRPPRLAPPHPRPWREGEGSSRRSSGAQARATQEGGGMTGRASSPCSGTNSADPHPARAAGEPGFGGSRQRGTRWRRKAEAPTRGATRLKGECAELALTEDDLRACRPPAKGRGAKKAAKAAAKTAAKSATPSDPDAPPRKGRRKKAEA
ncbi:MAG: hypothetical protein JW751_04810 [Polyangiaceae bacterium]|nr:hypothetical protein [Polyangiaceae bacterium]